MTNADLCDIYTDYITCLNTQDWPGLERFVDDDAIHNGQRIGLAGYRAMLERDLEAIPDLHFDVQMLIVEAPRVASRICFDCRPKGTFFGLAINGKRVRFTEHVFYQFRDAKIFQVWSVVDKAAIETQLQHPAALER